MFNVVGGCGAHRDGRMTVETSRLRQIRFGAGLTLEEAAKRIDISPQALFKIERDEALGVASIGSLARVAKAYDAVLVYDIRPAGGGSFPLASSAVFTPRRKGAAARKSRTDTLDAQLTALSSRTFAGLELEPERRRVRFGREQTTLARLNFLTLSMLVEAKGGMLEYDVLCRQLWGTASPQDIATLRVVVTKLRADLKKMGADHLAVLTDRVLGGYSLMVREDWSPKET